MKLRIVNIFIQNEEKVCGFISVFIKSVQRYSNYSIKTYRCGIIILDLMLYEYTMH